MQIFQHLSFIQLLIVYNTCFGKLNIIELSYDLGPDSPPFNGTVKNAFTYIVLEAGYTHGFWLALGKFCTLESLSTQVGAPYALNPNGLKIDEIPIEQFFAEAAVINVVDKVASTNNYEVTVDDVKEWVAVNGVFPNNCIVIFYTGWGKGRYPDHKKYFGNSTVAYPGVSFDAMKEILNYEKTHGIYINAFGIDTFLFDYGISFNAYPVSTLLTNLNKYAILSMTNLESLPATGARLMVAPLKIRHGAGSPARVFARLPYSN